MPLWSALILIALIVTAFIICAVILNRNPANNPRDEGADCEPVHVAFKRGKGR